ncbi:hypothetical protein SAMN04515692_12079 [Leifsonia sp. CL147]|nr:hypothetical protein SAMN04515694_11979 [Leifsonia sp. CL154]SFL99825.1 hypothetical protein SAMN04515692_12079 [Leifsonia sp. CL147]
MAPFWSVFDASWLVPVKLKLIVPPRGSVMPVTFPLPSCAYMVVSPAPSVLPLIRFAPS